MIESLKRPSLRALLLLSTLLFMASTAWAQTVGTKPIYRIAFKPGAESATLKGTVTQPAGEGDMHNPGSERYTLRVRGGQLLRMEISSDNGRAVFSLLTPDYEIVEDVAGVKSWSGKIKLSGDYYVTVFIRDGAASRFKLKVTLRQGPHPRARSRGASPEEDASLHRREPA